MEQNESIIQVSSGLLAALSHGAFQIKVMEREILVLECIVAGTSFRNLREIEPTLETQIKLELKREPENEFDGFAVALIFSGNKIGYLPKNKNEVIARLMDAGKQFYGILEAKEWEGNWLKLDIKLYLKD